MKLLALLFGLAAAACAQTPVIMPGANTGTPVTTVTCTGTAVVGGGCGGTPTRPVAFVQSRSAVGLSSLAYSSNVAAGNMLVLILGSEGAADPLTITDTLNTPFTKILALTGNANNIAAYSGIAPASGPDTVNVTGLGTPWTKINLFEFGGVSSVMTSNSNFDNAGANPENISITTTGKAMIAAGIIGFHSGNVYSIVSGGFTLSSQANGTDATAAAWANQSATGTYTASFTEATNSNDRSATAIVAFAP